MSSENRDNQQSNDPVFITKKEKKTIPDLKDVSVFGDVTLSNIMEEIYSRTTEQHKRAIELYDKIAAEVEGVDNIFIIGEKASPYLDIAQKSTDNMIKMLSVGQKILEASGAANVDEALDTNAIIDMLEQQDILPEEFRDRNKKAEESTEENRINIDEVAEEIEEEPRIKLDEPDFSDVERFKKDLES